MYIAGMKETRKRQRVFGAAGCVALLAVLILPLVGCSLVPEGGDASPPPLTKEEIALVQKMGGEVLSDGNVRIGLATIDRSRMEISFPAEVNLGTGDLEVLICIPGGRAHESLLITGLDPFHLQLALILLGAENGTRLPGGGMPQGSLLAIDLRLEGGERHPVEKWLRDKKTGGERKSREWVFVGSNFAHDGTCLAKEEGNIANVWSFGNTIIDNPSCDGDGDDELEVFGERTPRAGAKVSVFVRPLRD